ncbi:MAG: HEAT repeat domain-containing protein [Isosphaeraceae bacterium]
MGRLDAAVTLIVLLISCSGCGLGPRNFRKINHPAPLMRARAIGLGSRRSTAEVIPLLLGRLNDPDVVVRMAAHEELKRRTGQDFGYQPWASEWERADAINRWRAWLMARPVVPPPAPSRPKGPPQPRKSLPQPG